MDEKRELTLTEFINSYKEFCASYERCVGCPLEDISCNVQASDFEDEIVLNAITEFLKNKNAPKPVEMEWVWVCQIYRDCDYNKLFCGTYEILGENDTKSVEDILMEYQLGQPNDTYIATIEKICRVKKAKIRT